MTGDGVGDETSYDPDHEVEGIATDGLEPSGDGVNRAEGGATGVAGDGVD